MPALKGKGDRVSGGRVLAARALLSCPLSPYGQRNTPVPLCHFVTFPPYYGGIDPLKGAPRIKRTFLLPYSAD